MTDSHNLDNDIVDAEIVEDDLPNNPVWRTVGLIGVWTTDGRKLIDPIVPSRIVVMRGAAGPDRDGATRMGHATARVVGGLEIQVLLAPHEWPANLDMVGGVHEYDNSFPSHNIVITGATVGAVTYNCGPNAFALLNPEPETGLVPVTQIAPANTIIPSAIQQLREFLVTLDDGRARMEEEGDVEGLSNGAADILLLTGDLSTIAKDARLGIARVLDEEWFTSGRMKVNEKTGRPSRLPELEVENLGLVKVEGGSERKGWESEKLLRKIIMAQVVDPETEEPISYDHPTELAERICEVLISVLPVTGSLAWKVGSFDKKTQTFSGLRGLGIEPEDFCDEIVKTRIANVPKRHGESE